MNTVFILTDQHNPFFTGCYGHRLAETPALDSIAARGTRFQYAYCNSPLCVPARAALFTGRYVFENGCWDNALPWNGCMRGWPHFLRERSVQLTTIGKLDFQPGVDHGIGQELLAGHRSSRDIHGLFRHEPDNPPRWSEYQSMQRSGPRTDLKEEDFNDYKVAQRAAEWLLSERPTDRPWVLNVNFVQPHPAWPCPPQLWEKWQARVRIEDLEPKYFEPFEKLHPYHQSLTHPHFSGGDRLLVWDNLYFRRSTWYRNAGPARVKHWAYANQAFVRVRAKEGIDWTPGVPGLVARQRAPHVLDVRLRSATPNFKTYRVRFDGGSWRNCPSGRLRWKLTVSLKNDHAA